MARKVILSADSTCDIGEALQEKYEVSFFPFHILLGDKSYIDGVDIVPEDLYRAWREEKLLPKTAAISSEEYKNYFKQWVDEGYDVIHINLGSGISAAHQNARIAADELGHVYPIDSQNLSTGIGLLVIEAGDRIAAGMEAQQIAREVAEMVPRSHASFVLDTLEFMRAGGRCSSVAAFGANLLKLKPQIQVDNQGGAAMSVGKKYRGVMEKVLVQYTAEQLKDRDDLKLDHVFITHSGVPQEHIEIVRREIEKLADFGEIHVTRASCTISCHCGPGTLGVLYMTK